MSSSLLYPSVSWGEQSHENRILRCRFNDRDAVLKQYARKERFVAEKAALSICERLGISPAILSACEDQLVLYRTWIDGTHLFHPSALEKSRTQDASKLGTVIRVLHSVKMTGFGDLGGELFDNWQQQQSTRISTRLGQASLSTAIAMKLEKCLQASMCLMTRTVRSALLQHDLKPSNLVKDRAGEVRIIDFDQAKCGDPLSDVAKLKWRTFNTETVGCWQVFCQNYFGTSKLPAESEHAIDFYDTMHCIGALAYWNTFRFESYRAHAVDAMKRLRCLAPACFF